MKLLIQFGLLTSALFIYGCGGGGGDSSSQPPASTGPVFSVSTTSVTISGKQFAEPDPAQRINFNYSRNDVSRVDVPRRFTHPDIFDGDIFRAFMDTSQTFVDISSANSDLEGGTYQDEMVVTPTLQSGAQGTPITISLTLVQEPTTPITTTPEVLNVELVEGGPAVRTKVMINAGNTIRWEVGSYSYTAEDILAVTSDPATGTGSQEVDIVITPTPLLVDEIKQQEAPGYVEIDFHDLDAPGNFWIFGINLTLVE